MGRIGRIVSAVIISAAVFSAGAAVSYLYVNDNTAGVEKTGFTEETREKTESNEGVQKASVPDGLSETAVFSYEIYNEDTAAADVITGVCPFELIGKNMSDVKEYYPDWNVTEFSSDEVVLQKNIGGKNDERYIVSVYDDYVTVFYESSEDGIYMITDIPVAGLESDKQDMLNEGIFVEGRERLNRILEDYSS